MSCLLFCAQEPAKPPKAKSSRRTRASTPLSEEEFPEDPEGTQRTQEVGPPGGLDPDRWGFACVACGGHGEVLCCEVGEWVMVG